MTLTTPIRIARIVTRLDVSGPARHVCSLTTQLDPRKFQSWLICGRAEKTEREGFEIASEAEVSPIYVNQLRRGLGLRDLGASLQINRLLKTIKPQLVATHTAKAGALGRTIAFLRAAVSHERIRLVHTFHGHVFHSYFNSPATRALIAVERYLARRTDMIITVSPTIRRQLIEEYRIASAEKVRTVPLGFEFGWLHDLPHCRGWLRARLGVGESTVIFGAVGRLAKIKNTGLVLKAFARMLRLEATDARLVVIGDGELLGSLQMLARELAIENRVLFCGWLLDRAKIYSDLDVTCLSSFNEGTPVCLIESLAAGIPVVATRVGGVPDVISDGVDGELVESSDEQAFAAALAKLARQKHRISPERTAAVTRHYATSRLVRDIESLYEEVLDNECAYRAVPSQRSFMRAR